MKLKSSNPIDELSGTAANSQLVFYMLNGKLVARARVKVPNPRTPEQRRMREIQGAASKQWNALPLSVRNTWNSWATRWLPSAQNAAQSLASIGRGAYISAARHRVMMELEPYTEAPLPLPAPELISAEEVATGDPKKFSFRVRTAPLPSDSGVDLPDLVIVARITPATIRESRAPYPNQLRLIAGPWPASSCPLPAGAEAVVTVDSNRFSVETGQRFAFELTPVRLPDGVPGRPLWVDATRM